MSFVLFVFLPQTAILCSDMTVFYMFSCFALSVEIFK